MGFNLTNEFIDQTFPQLVQISGSQLLNGTGSVITDLDFTGSHVESASHAEFADTAFQADNATLATNATSASYIPAAGVDGTVASASVSLSTTSASFADNSNTASFALNFNPTATASYATFAESASHAIIADSALTVVSASYAATATSASHAVRADGSGTAEDLIITVKNVQASTIAAGVPVYSNGVTGENVNVLSASNDSSATMPAIGITQTSISANGNGVVVISGREANINTSGLVAGKPVYVGLNGALTATKPTGSALIQNIGTAAKINASGEIIVQGAGRSNDLPNLTTDYVWLGDSNQVPQAVASSSIVVDNANTASYVAAANIVGTVASASAAISSSHAIRADISDGVATNARLNVADITASNATFTSASIGNLTTVTGSATIIGDQYIILNSDAPVQRFAGLKVYDSNSALTGSFEWDSIDDNWIQVETGGTSAGMLTGISGSKGSEAYPANNTILKGTGNHTVQDSSIVDNGTNVTTTLPISASGGITGSLNGNADTATSASYATTASFATNIAGNVAGNLVVTGASRNGSTIDSNFKQSFGSPGNNQQADLVALGSGTINSKNYTNRNFFVADYSGFGNQFKDYFSIEYYDSFTYNYGCEFNVNGVAARLNVQASGSGTGFSAARTANMGVYDDHDGTGQLKFVAGDSIDTNFILGNRGMAVTGSVYSKISDLTITSNSASLDLQNGDMFRLTLVSGSNTHLYSANVREGQTVSLQLKQPTSAANSHGTVSFGTEFKFAGGTAPTATAASGSIDVVTLQAFDGTSLLGTSVLNLS